jgi:hypothetical protein
LSRGALAASSREWTLPDRVAAAVKEQGIDAGGRPGRATEEPAQIKTPEKNAELEPSNETIVRGDAGPESSRGMPIFPGM